MFYKSFRLAIGSGLVKVKLLNYRRSQFDEVQIFRLGLMLALLFNLGRGASICALIMRYKFSES